MNDARRAEVIEMVREARKRGRGRSIALCDAIDDLMVELDYRVSKEKELREELRDVRARSQDVDACSL